MDNTIKHLKKQVGIDEVGRGCWAGPLVAGAVLLVKPIAGLNDSKLLSKNKREKLAQEIKKSAVYGLGWVWPDEIDKLGLTAAVAKAMRLALDQIADDYDEIIIDGNYNYFPDNTKASFLIKADSLVPSVSAASILAKVARDEYMAQQSLEFPHYGFEKHVGYGTKLHLEMLKQHGVCSLHRMTFKPIQNITKTFNLAPRT